MALTVADLQGLLNGTSGGVDMITASPTSALQNEFMQTPGYQLAYGNNTIMDPSLRFLFDPGVQMSIQAGLPSVLNNYASKGLGQSGALAKALGQYMYNNYGNFISGQENLFQNYQKQLQDVANFGSTQTGGQQSFDANSLLGQLLAQANLGTGQNIGQANLGTAQNLGQAQLGIGQDIASLLGSQGAFNANAILNTGAAQANNLFNGLTLNTQIGSNALASNNQSYSSALGGAGSMAGFHGTTIGGYKF